MKYIKKSKNYITIPEGYEQIFTYPNFTTVNETAIIKLREDGMVDKEDIDLVEFIYNVGFATDEQIERFASLKQMEHAKERADNLCSCAILNKFVLMDDKQYRGKLPEDIKVFYCMQSGGKLLLEQFKGIEMPDWIPSKNCHCSKNISKFILNTEIYLEMITAPNQLFMYDKSPFYMFAHFNLKGGPVYGFKTKDGQIEYVLTEVFRTSDHIRDIRERIRRNESLLKTKMWKRYYHDCEHVPLLIMFADNDDAALSIAKEVANSTQLENVVYSTDIRFLRGTRNSGVFLMYNAEEDNMYEVTIPLFQG